MTLINKEQKMSKYLEKGKYYYRILANTITSEEKVVINGVVYAPRTVTTELYTIPFRVRSIEAVNNATSEECDLITDEILRIDDKLNHNDYDIEISLDFNFEYYPIAIEDFLEDFILVTDEQELKEIEESFVRFENYMNEMSDKYETKNISCKNEKE